MATQVYVIKVRNAPPPKSQLLPSERRYSAQGVLGLACVHLALACLATILASLRTHALERLFWPFVLVPVTASASGISGLLAWRRWYEGVYIRVFLAVATVSCFTCASIVIADILTAADLQISTELHAVITSLIEMIWCALSALVAWRGMRNKKADHDAATVPCTAPLAAHAWSHNDPKSQARVLQYLREQSRPPVEGKEKGGDDVTSEQSSS